MIYFLQRENGDVKIGYTSDYTNRLYCLQSEHGKLTLLAAEAGMRERENELHKTFSSIRLRDSEWFNPSDSLMGYIAQLPPYDIGYDNLSITMKVPALARSIFKAMLAQDVNSDSMGEAFIQYMLVNHPDIVQMAERGLDLELGDYDPYKQAIEEIEGKSE